MSGGRADYTLYAVLAGFALDLLAGDPHWLYHPVRLIGLLITGLEQLLRKLFPGGKKGERAAGACLAVCTAAFTGLAVYGLLFFAAKGGNAAYFLVSVLLNYWLFAARSLRDESMKVYDRLKEKDLPGARRAVSMIVGRDTAHLDEAGVTKAAVETVAENTSDGVIAPMFYLMIGGPAAGWIYKAVNTMDSMVGYKNDRYRFFGTAAARLDDILNYLPSRLSALLMIAAGALLKLDARGAYRIWRRDRRNHASPNSAQTESVMAGALNLQLAGDAFYFGKLTKKKTIGDDIRRIAPEDIPRANRLMLTASVLGLLLMGVLRGLVY